MPYQNKAFIALGSNLGDRRKNCERAAALLRGHPHITVQTISSWYKTEALTLENETQPDYLNGVVKIETDLSPSELLKTCKEIEKKMGRESSKKRWQPRLIDLDILFYKNEIRNTPALTIPHPLLHERLFVLEPLNEIAANFVHPILKKTVAELLQKSMGKSRR